MLTSIYLWIKNWLGIVLAVAVILAAHLGFCWLTRERIEDPGLRTRMYVFCRLIEESAASQFQASKSEATPDHFAKVIDAVLQETCDLVKTDGLVPMSIQKVDFPPEYTTKTQAIHAEYLESGLKKKASDELTQDELKTWIAQRLSTIANSDPMSHAILRAVSDLRLGLTCIKETKPVHADEDLRDTSPLKIRTRFWISDYHRKGVDFRPPGGDYAQLLADARLFLKYRNMFGKDAQATPASIKWRPWLLLRAYDIRRYNLSESIPVAVGILALATGLFVQIRLCDIRASKDGTLEYRLNEPPDHWIPLWAVVSCSKTAQTSASTELSSSPDQSETEAIPVARSSRPEQESLFTQPWTLAVVGGMVCLALFVEFFLNTPQVLAEWLPNTPIMTFTGFLMGMLWMTLWDLGQMRLNPQLAERTQAFRARLLRPLYVGITALLLVTAWGIGYSFIELAPLSSVQNKRAWLQILLCLLTAALLLRMTRNLHRNLRDLPPPADHEKAARAEINLNHVPLTESIWPLFQAEFDRKLVSAALMVLLPLPQVLEILLK